MSMMIETEETEATDELVVHRRYPRWDVTYRGRRHDVSYRARTAEEMADYATHLEERAADMAHRAGMARAIAERMAAGAD